MARITTYALDSNISLNDKLVGTDADDNSITKNYSIDALGDGLISLKDIITGTGTLNTIPMFTPDGQIIGDSTITQDVGGNITVGVNLTVVDDLTVEGNIDVDNSITVGGVGSVFNGTVTFNDNITINADTTFEGEANFQNIVKDENSQPGILGQVLTSTGNAVLWKNLNAISEVKTATVTVTDAKIRTLGTVPVEIIPSTTDASIQIIGLTIQNIGNGDLGDSYDWSASGNGVFYGQGFTSTQHRVEINNSLLPEGGASLAPEIYVASITPGGMKSGASIQLSTTTGVNPSIPIGESPSAEMIVNVTYRIIPTT